MENIKQTVYKIQAQIGKFLGKLPVSKSVKRFVAQAVYGVQAKQSVRLSEIGRAL